MVKGIVEAPIVSKGLHNALIFSVVDSTMKITPVISLDDQSIVLLLKPNHKVPGPIRTVATNQ